MSVSKKKRFEVFKRDGFACQYCGSRPPDVVLECDHVTPRCEGGSDEYNNLITSCFDCNRGKSGNTLGDSDCDRVQQMQVEQIAQLAAFNQMLIECQSTSDRQFAWLVTKVCENMDWAKDGLVPSEEKTLRVFARQLSFDQIVESAEAAGSRRISSNAGRWRYFCGCCWRRIKNKADSVG